MRCTRLLPALFAFAAVTAAGRAALAWDALAEPCDLDKWQCESGHVHFTHLDQLPIEFDFDTGWVPPNSPLQVHVWAGVFAHTRIELAGHLDTTWPDALTFKTPGDKDGGLIGYHYGLTTGAEGMVTIDFAGQTYSWQADIPYVPQIDFQVEGQKTFDAWAFDPGVTLHGETMPQKVVQVSLASLIGANIPGADGGFELDVAMEVNATYKTTEIGLEHPDKTALAGGPILKEDGASSDPYLGGPAVDVTVHPKGTVDYDGVLHLIPAFYVSAFGNNWSIPIADIPIAFPITQSQIDFDPKEVHVPLPDLVLTKKVIDFGDVPVGEKKLVAWQVLDAGEADLTVDVTSGDPEQFPVYDASFEVASFDTFPTAVRFTPTKPGPQTTLVTLASNDPSDPIQTFIVKGNGVAADVGPTEGGAVDTQEAGSCGCRAAGSDTEGAPTAFAAVALAGLLAARRKKRG